MNKIIRNSFIIGSLSLIPTSAFAASVTIQPLIYFSTAAGFGDGDISVYNGTGKWSGVTDSTGATTHSGSFGTVLDYRFVGTNRGAGVMQEKANGGGTYLTSTFTDGTYGTSGGQNDGLDVWTTTNPDNVGTFDTTPDSDLWVADHVAGSENITGTIDVSGLLSAKVYFIYGSYKNAATINLTDTSGGLGALGTLSLPGDGPDNDRLVIQEVTIDNSDSALGTISFNYATGAVGRGRFSGVIVAAVPEPSSAALLGLGALGLLVRRRR